MTDARPLRILALTGGHRVDLDAFTAMLDAICAEHGWVFAHAVQPAAQRWLTPQHAGDFDVILCHDIPGLALKRGTPPTPVGPEPATAAAVAALLEAGQGLVFLHHALAGWPGWPGWAEVLGGRYHYAPGRLRGVDVPDDGYRFATYTAQVLAPGHPVCAGLEDFTLSDELYCCPVFEDDVLPLLRADVSTAADQFQDTFHEVLGTPRTDGPWVHAPASDLIAWAKVAGRSPVAYIQPGDGPDTFALPAFRRLIGNALDWAASPTAHAWAADNATPIDLMPTASV